MKCMYFAFLSIILLAVKLVEITARLLSMLFEDIKDEIEDIHIRLFEHRNRFANKRDKQ